MDSHPVRPDAKCRKLREQFCGDNLPLLFHWSSPVCSLVCAGKFIG